MKAPHAGTRFIFMSADKNREDVNVQPNQRDASGDAEPLRHKGDDQRTPEEKKSGAQPDGNGGTNMPAAFPDHN